MTELKAVENAVFDGNVLAEWTLTHPSVTKVRLLKKKEVKQRENSRLYQSITCLVGF